MSKGKWTFANLEHDWVNDTYDTKEETIREGSKHFDEFLIGRLVEIDHLEYVVDKIEKVEVNER